MGCKKQQRRSSAAAAATETGKGQEMEKQMTEKGRDGRKYKQKGREEEDATAAGHQFFKVIVPEQSEERLACESVLFHPWCFGCGPGSSAAVPQQLTCRTMSMAENPPTIPGSLKGSSGNTWKVVLTWDCEGLGFTKGSKEFARHHSLVLGHFLVFTYDGCSQFPVAVFYVSGVEDKLALDVQPCEAVIVKIEEEEHVVDVDVAGLLKESAPPEGNGTLRKRVRQINDVTENGPAFF